MYTSKHVWPLSFTTRFKFVGYNPGVPQSAQTSAAAFTDLFPTTIKDKANVTSDFMLQIELRFIAYIKSIDYEVVLVVVNSC